MMNLLLHAPRSRHFLVDVRLTFDAPGLRETPRELADRVGVCLGTEAQLAGTPGLKVEVLVQDRVPASDARDARSHAEGRLVSRLTDASGQLPAGLRGVQAEATCVQER